MSIFDSDFFKDDSGRKSMTRLLCWMSFFPSSYVVMIEPSENTLAWYVGAYVLGYIGGKAADAVQHRRTPVNVENVGNVNLDGQNVQAKQ